MKRYKEILDEAWQQHLQPRSESAPTVISLFAGCGGSSLGYSMAGYRELLAVEWDDNAAQTFRLNFPGVSIWHGDIKNLSSAEVMRITGLKPKELDVLDGSPPCQGFSTAGKRVMEDPRNGLFHEYVRLLHDLKPRVFIMENVSGMIKGKMKLIFAEIMQELRAAGDYKISARLVNAMYFGVPQSRERIIFIGSMNETSFPKALSAPQSLRFALDDVVNTPIDIESSRYPAHTISMKLLRKMNQWEGGHQYHKNGSMFGLRRLSWTKPSRTVLREDGDGASCQCCHPSEDRRLTIPEIKRVGSFPEQFRMTGKTGEQWARIGNSVPPLFMREIARHIKEEILGTPAMVSDVVGDSDGR